MQAKQRGSRERLSRIMTVGGAVMNTCDEHLCFQASVFNESHLAPTPDIITHMVYN